MGERHAVWKGVGVTDAVSLLDGCGRDGREHTTDSSEGVSSRRGFFLHVNLARYRMASRTNRSKA